MINIWEYGCHRCCKSQEVQRPNFSAGNPWIIQRGHFVKGRLDFERNHTLPKTNIYSPSKMDGWKMKFPIGKAYCQGDTLVSGRVIGNHLLWFREYPESHWLLQDLRSMAPREMSPKDPTRCREGRQKIEGDGGKHFWLENPWDPERDRRCKYRIWFNINELDITWSNFVKFN